MVNFTEAWQYFSTVSSIELIAVTASLLYVLLAAKENIWCWPAAIVSTLLYTIIFYDVYLWMDSLLQLYYLLMAFYGWYCWRVLKNKSNTLTISTWNVNRHLGAIGLLSLISVLLGWMMATYTPTHFPYLDSATTVFAIFATYLTTQKVLENWLYFIVIDFVSIYLYVEKGLHPTAALFVCYVFLAGFAYWQWLKHFREQQMLTQVPVSH